MSWLNQSKVARDQSQKNLLGRQQAKSLLWVCELDGHKHGASMASAPMDDDQHEMMPELHICQQRLCPTRGPAIRF